MSFISWIVLYMGLSASAYVFAVANVHAAGMENAGIQLKLLIRFVVNPLMWESMKAAHLHAALMNPSPGVGLNVANFMVPIINQTVYSRLLLFLMTNDGSFDVLTVQIIISLNELMMHLTMKHRNAFFTRLALGSSTADAILSTERAEELHAVALIGSTLCELGAIMFITALMARATDPRALLSEVHARRETVPEAFFIPRD